MRSLLRRIIRPLRPRSPRQDDFNWETYHLEYRAELEDSVSRRTQQLNDGDARFLDGKVQLRDGLLPLHPNHACIYETIHSLQPESVAEIGCGGGDHLRNLQVLFPGLALAGYDRSVEQLALLERRSPHIASFVRVVDITMPPSSQVPSADLVFTQAVVMHLQLGNSHLVALANLFRMARRYLVLMENWGKHRFLDDIHRLHDAGMLSWQDVHCYIRRFNGRPRLMLLSSSPLESQEPLVNYRQLTDAMDRP